MAKGLLIDFEAMARPAHGDPQTLLREIRELGYEVYRREFRTASDYVMHFGFSESAGDSAERFLEAVFRELDLKPKRTELMTLAPVFAELNRHVLFEDVPKALPALASGHRVAVVTSLPSFLVVPVLEPVKAQLAAVLTPKEAKAVLPNPKAYQAALAALKLRARDAALVSPHCPDLGVAKPLGLRTVFLRRQGEEACPYAAVTVHSFDEVEGALKPPAKAEAPAPKPVEVPAAPPVGPGS